MSDIAPLLARLEAATSKLEALAASGSIAAPAAGGAPATASSGGDGEVSEMVTEFEEIINTELAKFTGAAGQIGGEVDAHAKLFAAAFAAERDLLSVVSQSKKPADADFPAIAKPLFDAIAKVNGFPGLPENRRSKLNNHLTTVAEGVSALAWVSVTPKPGPYVKDMADTAEFYANRVLKDYKEQGAHHVEWVKSFKEIWVKLQAFIKKYHTTGLTWNPRGGVAAAPAASAAAPAAAAPAATPATAAKPAVAAGGAGVNLFAELNKGGAITGGLKKVDKSQMTHKNPELRASSVVKGGDAAPKAAATPKAAAAVKKGTPKFELEGKKWCIEWQENNQNLVIEDCNLSQVLYIYKCTNSVIKVNKKINTITLDGCKKVALVFESAVAAVEVVNCQSVQVQIIDKVPTVNIDKTDGIQVYLSAKGLDTQIVTAKSSEMNISVPGKTPEDDLVEHPVPEQFLTSYDAATGKFKTTTLESLG